MLTSLVRCVLQLPGAPLAPLAQVVVASAPKYCFQGGPGCHSAIVLLEAGGLARKTSQELVVLSLA